MGRYGWVDRDKSILTIAFAADILGLCINNSQSFVYVWNVLNLKFQQVFRIREK